MDIYKGYKTLQGTTDEINQAMENIDYSQWNINEYLLIENTDDGSQKELRFNGFDFIPLKLPSSKYIKAKNALQRCALDALANPDITVVAILGLPGSGKSFLATQMALYAVKEKGFQSKILGVREPLGEGRELGFLPGDFESKNSIWTLPIVQQLHGEEWELRQLKDQGVIDFNIPTYMKGTSYSSTVLIIDEAEDLTEKQIRLIGTRVGMGSRIFFDGDHKQSASNNSYHSPLIRMCNYLKGNPLFACVMLQEDVRSETSKLFAELFEKEKTD